MVDHPLVAAEPVRADLAAEGDLRLGVVVTLVLGLLEGGIVAVELGEEEGQGGATVGVLATLGPRLSLDTGGDVRVPDR
jgi:hypothetical protein